VIVAIALVISKCTSSSGTNSTPRRTSSSELLVDHAGDQRVKPVPFSAPVDSVAWIVHPRAPPGRLSEWRLV